MNRRCSAFLAALTIVVPVSSGAQGYPFSQRGTVSQMIAFTEITVAYGRPVARGRVHYREAWLYFESRLAAVSYILSASPTSSKAHDVASFLDTFEKLARQLEVDIRFQQHSADFAQAILDVGFAKNTATAQAGERGFELFAQVFEHSL